MVFGIQDSNFYELAKINLNKNKDGRILTSKNNPFNHGIGLESVRRVAEKYHGSVIIETKDNCFIIKIAMCDLSEKL